MIDRLARAHARVGDLAVVVDSAAGVEAGVSMPTGHSA